MSGAAKQVNVVDILDSSHVVLNVGANAGVKPRDRFVIFANNREVRDIDGRSLGFLELVKGFGRVSHVQETMCILATDIVDTGFEADADPMAKYRMSGGSTILHVVPGDFARKV
jgi:hypothetical protein